MTRITARKLGLFAVFALAATLLTGCIDTDQPLLDLNVATIDPALVGTWAHYSEGSDNIPTVETLKIQRAQEATSENVPSGMMHGHDSSSHGGKDETLLGDKFFSVARIGNFNYISAYIDSGVNSGPRPCYIYRYRVAGGTLEVWEGNESVKNQFYESGQLVSNDPSNYSDRNISKDSLVNYLSKNPGDDLFPDSNKTVYYKVDETKPASDTPATSTTGSTSQATTNKALTTKPTPSAGSSESFPFLTILPWALLAFVSGMAIAQNRAKIKPQN